MGLASLRHVESSWTRDRTHVPCIGRWILNTWTTSGKDQWEVLEWLIVLYRGRTSGKSLVLCAVLLGKSEEGSLLGVDGHWMVPVNVISAELCHR